VLLAVLPEAFKEPTRKELLKNVREEILDPVIRNLKTAKEWTYEYKVASRLLLY